jgi:hypothetical protein
MVHKRFRWWHILPFLWSVSGMFTPTHALTNVTKGELPYEILSIQVDETHMHIHGWAFISYKQHFIDESDHAVAVNFLSLSHQFTINAQLYNQSKTDLMHYFGSPMCSTNSTHQIPEVCNYHYERVGFVASIPLHIFQSHTMYQANLVVHAFKANLSYQTPIYYPMAQDLVLHSKTHEYRFVSRLFDTSLQVNATTVIARKDAGKTGELWFYGTSCSTTYRNQLFFVKDSFFHNVFEKILIDDTSYYRVAGRISVCINSRRRLIEGTIITPVWIASPYVMYSGSPLSINKTPLNQPPYFTNNYIQLYLGEPLDVFKHVRALDLEDGDITHKVFISDTNFAHSVGRYHINMHVTDSGGLTTYHTVTVDVLPPPNEIPIIFAQNRTALQYSIFNALDGVSAYDQEDGDITLNVVTTNDVNTVEIGIYLQCYQVQDSQGALAEKCVEIKIVSYSRLINNFRFVSKKHLFYAEEIPMIWKTNIVILDTILKAEEALGIILD